jgi:hypothetical protein
MKSKNKVVEDSNLIIACGTYHVVDNPWQQPFVDLVATNQVMQ